MFATLMYHIVDRRVDAAIAVSEEAFDAQLAHLRREGYTLLTLVDVLRIVGGSEPPPRGGVYVTFDDGYVDNVHTALPRLREHGVEATIFVPTACVGRTNRWNASATYEVRHLSWGELETWVAAGGRVGGHTHAHESVDGLGRDELRATVELNKRLLEERLGSEARVFSYPYGDVTAEAEAEVARHYDAAFSVGQGTWDFREDRFAINRLAVDHHYTLRDFADVLERLFASFEAHDRTDGAHRFEQFPARGTQPRWAISRSWRRRRKAN